MPEYLSGSLQENLIILLVFNEDQCAFIRNAVDLDLFEGDYHRVASVSYNYIDEFKKPPKEHIADLLEDVIGGEDEKRKERYQRILENIYAASDGINVEYVINSISRFVQIQHLKSGVVRAAEELQRNNENSPDLAINILAESSKKRLDVFDPGVFLHDTTRSLNFLDQSMEVLFKTGIELFDRRGLVPNRKQLTLFAALQKQGKSWWGIYLAKMAIMQKLKVCHITLEMSEAKVAQRYFQAIFSIPKRMGQVVHSRFVTDDLNRLLSIGDKAVMPKTAYDEPEIRKFLSNKTNVWRSKLKNLVIKEFPTGSLTVNGLKAYLDSLETSHKFIPDLVILDYADLMQIDTNNYRHDVGKIYKDLRGIAVERNLAMQTMTQSNKEGKGAKIIDESNFAEDFSKGMTVDLAITYNQTASERELKVARLFVALGRDDTDKFTVLITQDYELGQFCLQSAPMVSKYQKEVERLTDEEE